MISKAANCAVHKQRIMLSGGE